MAKGAIAPFFVMINLRIITLLEISKRQKINSVCKKLTSGQNLYIIAIAKKCKRWNMKIRIITTNNLVFNLSAKGNDMNEIVCKIYDKKFIKVNDKTYINTNTIAIIQQLNWLVT